MIADELRRQADEFLDLIHLSSKIGRDPAERMQRYQDRRAAHAAASATMDTHEGDGQ